MIRKVSIRNFKSLRDVRVELERFTVFVGPNASGKTSILQALDLLCRMFRLEAMPRESESNREVSPEAVNGVEVAAESGGNCYRYRNETHSLGNGTHRAEPVREVASDFDSSDWTTRKWEAQGTSPLPLSVLLRLDTSKLISSARNLMDPTVMASEGTGMHSALASMALHDPDSWQELQANLRRIIPTIKKLRHTKIDVNPEQPLSLLFDTHGAEGLPASQVSEGTLLVLGLLTAVYGSDRPSLVLLDDLDRGLHPMAQKNLVTLLRGLLEANPELQIVATTHSPYLLDAMMPNEVRITFLQDGSTVCAPLEAHPKFPKWKDEMAPGEMWSLFGEKWLAEKKEAVA